VRGFDKTDKRMERENETRGAKKKKNNLKGRRKKEHMG
jgi:hypothetical protein